MYRLFLNYKTQRFKIIPEEEPFSTFDDGVIVARNQSLDYLKGVFTGLIAGQKYAQREYEVTDITKAITRAEAETDSSSRYFVGSNPIQSESKQEKAFNCDEDAIADGMKSGDVYLAGVYDKSLTGSMVSVLENRETAEVSTGLYASLENELKRVDITQHTELLLSIHKELCKNKKLSSFDIKGDSLLFVSNGVHFCATARTDVITAIDLHKDGSLIRTLFGAEPLIKMFSETDHANH